MPNVKQNQGVLSRIMKAITGKPDSHTSSGDDYAAVHDGLEKLKALLDERTRLEHMRTVELGRKAELQTRIDTIEATRIAALADASINDDDQAKSDASAILLEVEALRRTAQDADAVAAEIKRRISGMQPDIDIAIRWYKGDLAKFLDNLYRKLADRYGELAPEVAELALQIAAVQDVMMRYLLGNSNGFERRIYLPRVIPGEGKTIAPLLNADSHGFPREVSARAEEIVSELRAAGFIWKF